MNYVKAMENAGDDVIATIRAGQDLVASAVETVAKAVGAIVPELPVPDLGFPRPKELAASAFRFSEKLAEAQKDFAFRVLEALDPTVRVAKPRKAA